MVVPQGIVSLNIDQDATHVLSDLYDSLFLQSLLQHQQSLQADDAKTVSTQRDTRTDWHRFLDDLCSLCDSQCGGKSVVSIGVEQSSDYNIFWVSTASKYQQDAKAHLAGLIELLTEFPLEGANRHFAIAEISRRSVHRSTKRVHNYARRLQQLVCSQQFDKGDFRGSSCRSNTQNICHVGSKLTGSQVSRFWQVSRISSKNPIVITSFAMPHITSGTPRSMRA